MHRIASTGASDPQVIGEVLGDRRFQGLGIVLRCLNMYFFISLFVMDDDIPF